MSQDKKQWIKLDDEKAFRYHENQFKTPYRSTVHFCNFLKSQGLLLSQDRKDILDIGSGEGANISYLATKFPKSNFTGMDINKTLIKKGNVMFKKLNQQNCKLEEGDLYNFNKKYKNAFDGIISLQTLSWLPSYQQPLTQMIKLNPKWLAISSLFYDGFIECEIKVREYKQSKKKYKESFYNVYSLKLVEDFFKKNGYRKFIFTPFTIDIDVYNNKDGRMGTYTVKMENGSRIQISGPLLMNWYFIAAIK